MEVSTWTLIEYGWPVLLLLAVYYLLNWTRMNIPGPYGLPFIGHLTFFGKTPHLTLTKWWKQYGDVYQIRMGSWPTIVLNGKSAIKEALVHRADDFSGRPAFFSGTLLSEGKNLAFGKFDNSWIKQRQLASNCLYTFANARKNPVEEIIEGEVKSLVDKFMKHESKPFDPQANLLFAAAGVVYQICFGKTDNIEFDDNIKELIASAHDFDEFVNVGNPVDMMPWLRFIIGRKTDAFLAVVKRVDVVVGRKIAEHEETFDKDNLRDVTDGLLAALEKIPESEMKTLGLTRDQVLSTLTNMFGAGFDTIGNTMHWSLLLLSSFPDVQEKLYQEICDVAGSCRPPCLADKRNMPYTEATTAEILRFSCIFPLALPHCTTEDTSVGGYDVPKSTVVLLNFYSVTHDKEVWGDPYTFRPDRFLDEAGQLDRSVLDQFIPFSSGRRRCLAEFLARLDIFLLITGIVQKCKLENPAGDAGDLEPVYRQNLAPKPYRIVVKERV